MSLSGLAIHKEGPLNGHPLKYESHDRNKRKYVFNVWYDFSQFSNGRYDIELRFTHSNGSFRTYRDLVVVDEPLPVEKYPKSDRLVAVSLNDDRPLEEQVNTQPSMIREARRTLFSTPPKNVLIVRADQLGDMVTSIPAVRRLREFLPSARLVGLLSAANAELAESLRLFDEIIVIQFPEDEWERRRIFPLDKQYELQQRLSKFKFDVAIDLSIITKLTALATIIRSSLRRRIQRRSIAVAIGVYRYRCSRSDQRAVRLAALRPSVCRDGVLWSVPRQHLQVIRRDDLTRDRLAAYGLTVGDEFVVLHTGARLKFSEWPHYDTLASMIINQTDLKVVMMTDDPAKRAKLPRQLSTSDRYQLLDRRLPFDDFDAFLSFCTVFVGNASGPSHLASLRGTNVVDLFMARLNWNEWGHENQGYIVSRQSAVRGVRHPL